MQADIAAGKGIPPQCYFLVSAVFHYLGPAFAVLLFASIAPLGVAWLRILSAAVAFGVWRRPWRVLRAADADARKLIIALGVVLALMNVSFYLAIARLPLATIGAIEFVGPIALAAGAARGGRNIVALAMAVGGVALLTKVRLSGTPVGYAFAFANCGLFLLYVSLGHRLAAQGGANGIDRLSAAMLIAAIVAAPIGIVDAAPAFHDPRLMLAAIGVGISSSVIPYVTDQIVMARLPRATFALMLSILPAAATAIGILVLRQRPALGELIGILLVAIGVALHQPKERAS